MAQARLPRRCPGHRRGTDQIPWQHWQGQRRVQSPGRGGQRSPGDIYAPPRLRSDMIHPTAVVHPKAELGRDCEIGPYCVLGEYVVLGDSCRLHSHVVIDGHTRLGRRNEIFPFATLGLKTQDLKWKGGLTRTEIGDDNTIRESVTVHSATSDGDATVIGSKNHILAYS